MKVLLINPKSILVEKSKICRRFTSCVLPSGLAYLSGYLKKENIDVVIEDQFASDISDKELLFRIKQVKPDVIGFSCLTPAMSKVKSLVDEIRALDKNIKIILGNIHPTLFPEEVLKEKIADIVVCGEGEISLKETVFSLSKNNSLSQIKGISFREDGNIYHNAPRDTIDCLDNLIFPEWGSFNLEYYKNYPLLGIYNNVILPLQGSRGCPYKCIFCSQDKMYVKPRYRSTFNILEEIEYMRERLNVNFFGFNDAFFPHSIEQGFEFCDLLIKRKLHKRIKWITETRVDMVTPDLLTRMREAGLDLIMYGFEVGNQKILDSVEKRATLKQAYRAMDYTKKANIRSLGLFILGLPGETKQTCEETINFARKLNPDMAKFNLAVPFPGSKLFDEYKKSINLEQNPEKFTSWYDWSGLPGEVISNQDGMGSNELISLQRKAMLKFYVNPKKILNYLIKSNFPVKDLILGGYMLISRYFKSLILWFNPIVIVSRAGVIKNKNT